LCAWVRVNGTRWALAHTHMFRLNLDEE